ncbi:MAG: STAS domain-containing protein [Streptosporangiaceae bacterium]|jgi:anti-sigma B factor antagonist
MSKTFSALIHHRDDAREGPVVTVEGEIDLHTAGQLDQALQSASEQHERITVDLSGVEYLDSAAVRVLFLHAARLKLVLIVPQDSIVYPVVSICGLGRVAVIRTVPA